MPGDRPPSPTSTTGSALPRPSRSARWRWVSSRRAIVGGGVLAAVLSVGGLSAGASTTHGGNRPAGGSPQGQPAGATKPTIAGKVTALSGDDITVQDQSKAAHTVVYSASTTFRTTSGASSASALKVGQFIAVQGTTDTDGNVTAKSIVIGAKPPGKMGPGSGGKPGTRPAGGKGGPPTGSPAAHPSQ